MEMCCSTTYLDELEGLLQPINILLQIWEVISMDFITGLPPSSGFLVIFIVVGRPTKYAHFKSLHTGFTAMKVVALFVHMIYKLHGLPKTILSDWCLVFLSKF
ncbi:hypothetical protein Patl1_05356 [Pistacia atlantica]|uniref:Uncharacterized protein n=1 Tax=Pistacia atlantica TaxID=434234 RepID=A0ACC1BPF7_9ROSI|nr:hypothetical protein Patl1_05356 [Pistacia atlantica]